MRCAETSPGLPLFAVFFLHLHGHLHYSHLQFTVTFCCCHQCHLLLQQKVGLGGASNSLTRRRGCRGCDATLTSRATTTHKATSYVGSVPRRCPLHKDRPIRGIRKNQRCQVAAGYGNAFLHRVQKEFQCNTTTTTTTTTQHCNQCQPQHSHNIATTTF
jgi:hypothetical protein